MQQRLPRLSSQHTLFEANYDTEHGVRLQHEPFNAYAQDITHPERYEQTQSLGSALRAAGMGAFEYPSARDPAKGFNVALIQPSALASQRIENPTQWLCRTSAEKVTFSRRGQPAMAVSFSIDQFLLDDGRFPRPA